MTTTDAVESGPRSWLCLLFVSLAGRVPAEAVRADSVKAQSVKAQSVKAHSVKAQSVKVQGTARGTESASTVDPQLLADLTESAAGPT